MSRMRTRWWTSLKRSNRESPKTLLGDIEISGHFAAGRDIRIRNLATNLPTVWREGRTEKIRLRLLTKTLPKWLSEEDLWSGSEGIEFPSSVSYGVKHIAHPRREIAAMSQEAREKNLAGRDTFRAFEASLGRLLVLGDPGGGKTFSLRKLMRHAIEQALTASHSPVPFYLHLATWDNSRSNFAEWIIESISQQYGVHEQYLQQWLEDAELALFVDGLDELGLRRRRECITAINRFLSGNPATEVVIACRQREYEDARKLLQLRGSLVANPIPLSGLASTIKELGSNFQQLQEAVERNKRFRSLLQNPLFLHLALITYQRADVVGAASAKDMQSALLEEYISHCERTSDSALREPVKISWLTGTAQALRARKLVSFYPDRAPVEYFPLALQGQLQKITVWASVLAVLVPTMAVRITMTSVAHESTTRYIYMALTYLFPLSFGYLAMLMAREELRLAPVSRTTSAKKDVKLFLIRTMALFIVHGALAFALTPFAESPIAGAIVLIGFPVSMMWPPMRMFRTSERTEKTRMPFYPGEELSTVRRSAVLVGLLVGGGFYCSVTLSMSALEPGLKNALLFQPGINNLFFAVPIAMLAALKSGGADIIRRRACMWILSKHGLLPRKYFKTLESLRKSSILVPRLGSLEFRHVLVRDHLATKAPNDLLMRRAVILADE